ncbi:MAG TPA: hypothetical protein EYG68_00950 [Leucothrix mucor]|nr:hypothetical protein [Leucothrix mucor]
MRYLALLLSSFLLLSACGGGGASGETAPLDITQNNYSNLFAYNSSGKYNKTLKECASVTNPSFSCTLVKLPLLGQDTMNPSDQDILDRLVVSHQWMGDRFKTLLPELPIDLKRMFRAVTTIVIDDDIRPSYYWPGSGAIHIDAEYFWLTEKERDTISKREDPRNNYGNDLKWINIERYSINNQLVYMGGPLNGKFERPLNYLIYPLANVLYHELAHANDYAPPFSLSSIDKSDTIFAALSKNSDNYLTKNLYDSSPLRSNELVDFGNILYRGKKATDNQKNVLADYVGALFGADTANRFYSYSTPFEDTANLFTEAMMKYNYGLLHDTAFINLPTVEKPVYSDYLISWGARNRVADPSVKPRAEFIVKNILPEYDWDTFLPTQTDTVIPMTVGDNWAESLISTKSSRRARSAFIQELSTQKVPDSDFNMHR